MRRRTFVLGSLATVAGASAVTGLSLGRDTPAPERAEGEARRYGDIEVRRRAPAADTPNVLFVSLDDLNDWVGFLNNHPGTHTPNLDALAAKSLVFTQAYCTTPICLPSRSSILFGRAPYNSGVYDHGKTSRASYERLRAVTPSLIDDVWAAGYRTIGAGKIFHGSETSRWSQYRPTSYYLPASERDDPDSRRGRYRRRWRSPYDGRPIGTGERFSDDMIDFGPSGSPITEEPDGAAARWVQNRIREDRTGPLFLALGFALPHEPWRLPKRYFKLHPLEEVVVPDLRPQDLDDLSRYARDEVIDTNGIFERLRASGIWERAVQAYQAAISFVDDLLGRVLDDWASSPLADDSVIVVWSDNGYHLGEKLHFSKVTLWERATRVPMLVHVPGRFDGGQKFDRPVSTLDLGPTVAELCGFRIHDPDHDGASLLPLVAEPSRADDRPAITTWRTGNHSVRRGPWRYIRYHTGDAELYDHRVDPQEYVNLDGRPTHAEIKTELETFLPVAG